MATNSKIDINKATKDQLQSAGLRPTAADAVLKYREEHGRVADVEALRELSGVSGSVFEQLKSSVEVVGEGQAKTAKAATEATGQSAKAGAETAADVTKKAADTGAAMTAQAAKGAETVAGNVHEMASAVTRNVARAMPSGDELQEVAQTAARTAENVGQVWVHTMNAQLEDGVATFRNLVAARDYRDVVGLQTKFVSNSVSRFADLQASYLGAMSRLTGQLTAGQRRESRKAA